MLHKKIFIGCSIFFLPLIASAFAQEYQYTSYDPAGFISGVWDGLLAPWSLIARWFIDDVVMYAIPNTGWFYDFGFLIGLVGSLPLGWFFASLSFIAHIFNII